MKNANCFSSGFVVCNPSKDRKMAQPPLWRRRRRIYDNRTFACLLLWLNCQGMSFLSMHFAAARHFQCSYGHGNGNGW